MMNEFTLTLMDLIFVREKNMKIIKTSPVTFFNKGLIVFALVMSAFSHAQENSLSEQQKSAGWQLLFNGKDMSQWRNFKQPNLNPKWVVENGEMKLTGKGGGDILTKQRYENFDLRLEWKISKAGNSGIFIMADEKGSAIYSHAPEIQILDNELHSDNKIDTHLSGSLYEMVASPISSQKRAGQWNQARILLNNKVLKIWQNNVKVANILIGGVQWNRLVANSKFADWNGFGLSAIGHIGLQDHSDPVAFKNIIIKEL